MKRKKTFEASVSLFPFLDVLICTMGALILALAVSVLNVAKTARQEAAAAPAIAEAHDELALRVEQLSEQRTANLADLEAERAALSHVERHLRSLVEELDAARREADNLLRVAEGTIHDRAVLEARLAELAKEIEAAEARLALAKRERSTARPNFAIVPYVGPNGTRRKPIYIECRGDRIVVQPEGVELTADDFEGPLGPGNPLAAAVRAASEPASSAGEQPYPFLLVRPDGIEAYAAARAALRSWGSEFGYELIDADWELALPQRNPALAERIETEVADARVRQQLLAESVPRLRGSSGGGPMFRADPVRGIVQVGGDGGGGGSSRRTSRAFGSNGRGPGGPSSDSLAGGDSESTAAAGDSSSSGLPGGVYARTIPHSQRGPGGSGSAELPAFGDSSQQRPDGSSVGGVEIGFTPQRTSGSASGPQGRGPVSGMTPGDIGAELARERSAESDAASREAARGGGGSRAESPGSERGAAPQGGIAGGMPGSSDSGQPSAGEGPKLGEYVEPGPKNGSVGTASSHHKPPQSLSEKRGKDWALPEQGRNATPITRPIRLSLDEATLRVIDDDGTTRKAIAMDDSTLDAVDDLVGAVWDAIRDWGIAGRGQYWRPVLVIEVAPGAERRYAELQGLLSDSGLEVRPKLAASPQTSKISK